MKDEIVAYLLENGFTPAQENVWVSKMKKAVGETIVNGEHHVEYQLVELKFEFIGDGWEGKSEEDNKLLTQWKFYINCHDEGDFLVHDLKEFKNIFRIQ